MCGLQPYFKIPQLTSRYLIFAALCIAHEAYDDVDFFPAGRVPQARAPQQMPPTAPAPANPANQSDESDLIPTPRLSQKKNQNQKMTVMIAMRITIPHKTPRNFLQSRIDLTKDSPNIEIFCG